jgi:hypothetical protein
MTIITAILCIISSGLLFNDRWRGNWLVMGTAAAIAMVSTFFLAGDVAEWMGYHPPSAKTLIEEAETRTGLKQPSTAAIDATKPDEASKRDASFYTVDSSAEEKAKFDAAGNNVALLRVYLDEYPEGRYAKMARAKIAELEDPVRHGGGAAEVLAEDDGDKPRQQTCTRIGDRIECH